MGEWKISVPALVAGNNEVRIIARNDSGSSEIPLHISYTPPAPESETLRVFAVGISDYGSTTLNLNYAYEDAKAIRDFFYGQRQAPIR